MLSSDSHLNSVYNNNNNSDIALNTVAAHLTHDDKSDNSVGDNDKTEINKKKGKGQLAKKM